MLVESKPEAWEMKAKTSYSSGKFPDIGKSVGDDYQELETWHGILEPFGWKEVYTRGDVTYWRRPGKDKGVSATTGFCKGLKNFSSSVNLSTNGTHSKFWVYTVLNHGGDWKAAVKALSQAGYGTWIDHDGTEKPNPVPKGWKRAEQQSHKSPSAAVDLATLTRGELGMLDPGTLDAENVDHLVENWIYQGAINLLVGEVGSGKSQTAISLGAAANRGRAFFKGGDPVKKSKFIYVSAEEGMARVILPRLLAAGGDRDGWVPLIAQIVRKDQKTGRPEILPQSFANLNYWRLVFEMNRDASLMILDPLPAFLGRGADDHRNNAVRDVLRPFQTLLEEFNVACLGISHLNKTVSLSALHRVCGSIAYAALARTINVCVRDDQDRDLFHLAQSKNSYSELQAPYAYRIKADELPYKRVTPPYAEVILKTSHAVFENDRPNQDHVDELLGGDGAKRRRGPAPVNTDKVARFLLDFLKLPRIAFLSEIIAAAGAAGLVGKLIADKDGARSGSNLTALYRGADAVPTLPAPDDGWIIITPKDDPAMKSVDNRARWQLRRADSAY